MDRKEEMTKLHFEEAWTFQAIGNKFGISRERVRQIIGNSNNARRSLSEKFNLSNNSQMTSSELEKYAIEKLKGIQKNILNRKIASFHHRIKGDPIGEIGERRVHEKLLEERIGNELMSFSYPYDILTDNGTRIDVKTCKALYTFPNGKATYYRFSIRKEIKADCDIFIFYAIEDNRFWVVPFDVLPSTHSIYIHQKISRPWIKQTICKKLNDYENCFELLK